ncbi:MAG: hypothetical protein IPK25_12265 [Saprospiraceae bacterium]|nr:hypothetical protein [Saprospiraceae bacterium]
MKVLFFTFGIVISCIFMYSCAKDSDDIGQKPILTGQSEEIDKRSRIPGPSNDKKHPF